MTSIAKFTSLIYFYTYVKNRRNSYVLHTCIKPMGVHGTLVARFNCFLYALQRWGNMAKIELCNLGWGEILKFTFSRMAKSDFKLCILNWEPTIKFTRVFQIAGHPEIVNSHAD